MTSTPQQKTNLDADASALEACTPPGATAGTRSGTATRNWYLLGFGLYFSAMGIQSVLYPWILTQVLNESASRVGFAQMMSMVPMLTLVLFGGVVADRRELRGHLITLQCVIALVPLSLALIIRVESLSFFVMIAMSLGAGALGAFIIPAREAMLVRVANGQIQQTVTATTGIQFGSQIFGILLGGGASYLALAMGRAPSDAMGGAPLLVMQAVLLVLAALVATRLPRLPPADGERRHAVAEIRDSIAEVFRIDAIRPIVILMFFTGILYIGVFMVQLPIIVRDVYHGDSAALAILNTCFMLGTCLSAIVMTRYGHIRQQGRALILSTTASGLIMALILFKPPLYGLYAIAGLWGISGGISMVMGRTLVQAAAPADHRGRVLSIFQLGYMGGAPIGALLIGFAIDRIGPINAILIPTIGMIVLILIARYMSGVWDLRYEEG
ncbi:MAG TPA: hypothetical protein DCZ07_02780 [Alphaproteobacteria bacterium]|nr:hypothetical protein [Alphaproteobacteria bacterium]